MLHDLSYLFTAEDDRISKKFAESKQWFLERALARAKERRAQGIQAVQVEVERINTLSDRLGALGLERKAGGFRNG